MDLMLTSFGLSHLPRRTRRNTDIFYRMPPAALGRAGAEFMPDYAALLIADHIVIDEVAYDLLMRGHHESYGQVALMARVLHDEGLLRLENFDSIVTDNREFLDAMLERDLKELDSWVGPLKESIEAWQGFLEGLRGSLRRDFVKGRVTDQGGTEEDAELYEPVSYRMAGWLHSMASYSSHAHYLVHGALDSSRKRRDSEHRQALREVLAEYLAYVNANLLLANVLDTGFHDWYDLRPFYRDKFLRVARTPDTQVETVHKLFDISFPEFTFWSPDNIVRALKDKRIIELRQLVQASVNGEVEFDREFANRVLSEVLSIERSIGKLRTFVSYLTMPLGFIPVVGTPVQKAVEEAVVVPIIKKRRESYRWFYLISELADRAASNKPELGEQSS